MASQKITVINLTNARKPGLGWGYGLIQGEQSQGWLKPRKFGSLQIEISRNELILFPPGYRGSGISKIRVLRKIYAVSHLR